jgi:hypothetical protein
MISEDGSYRVMVDRTDTYIIELSAKKEGRRGNYIGVPYGEYELSLTIGTDRDAAKGVGAETR